MVSRRINIHQPQPKTTEELIHEAGLGSVIAAVIHRPELCAQIVAHLGEVEAIRLEHARLLSEFKEKRSQESTAHREVAPLCPAMREADLTVPRPARELAMLLGITLSSLYESSKRPAGRIERIEAHIPRSNARHLYRVRPSQKV
jgi:hypothetical protein